MFSINIYINFLTRHLLPANVHTLNSINLPIYPHIPHTHPYMPIYPIHPYIPPYTPIYPHIPHIPHIATHTLTYPHIPI